MRRIGVTGAFGLLGANVVSAILERRQGNDPEWRDVRIVAFGSSNFVNPLFSNVDVEIRSLDILDYDGVESAFEGIDELIHFAGKTSDTPEGRSATWDSNVIGCKNVFEAALKRGVKRVLYASSINVLGRTREGVPASEKSTPYGDPQWPISFDSPADALAHAIPASELEPGFLDSARAIYFDSKLVGYELAKMYYKEFKLPIVTIFPGIVVGPGDIHNTIANLVDSVWDKRLLFSFDGSSSFVTSSDFSKGALLALRKGRLGEAYIISGQQELNISFSEFQRKVMSTAGMGRVASALFPIVFSRDFTITVCDVVSRLFPKSSLSRPFAYSGCINNECSVEKARQELGYSPEGRIGDAIKGCRLFSQHQGAPVSATDSLDCRIGQLA
jgi:Nucleoside-diphosphate-sugar epimerases